MLRSILFVILLLATATQNASADITSASKPSFVDPSCIAPVKTTTSNALSYANTRLSSPNYVELKVEVQKNISKFLTTRLSAINIQTGAQCGNPLDGGCTIVGYKDSSGGAVTADSIYSFVITPILYQYFSGEALDKGNLEVIRKEFSTGYSGIETRPFDVAMKETITISGLLADLSNKSSTDILNTMDLASTVLAEKMSADGLFVQKAGYSSLASFPITSRLIECLDGTFRNLLMRDISASTHRTPFGVAQDYFKPAVMLALILYFIGYGYKIVMAHGMGKQSEIIMFGIKFALVFYFSVGEAWKDFAFDMLKSIPATVAQVMFSTMLDTGDGCSAYTPSMYPQGKGMLSFFDMIDCKYLNYIGLADGKSVPAIFYIIALPFFAPIPFVGTMTTVLGTAYLGAVTYAILAGIEIYISSILLLTFYVFLAPIVVPMKLFSKTEGICTAYQTKIIGTVIQSLMSVVLLVFLISLMDPILYGANPQENNLFVPPKQKFVNGAPAPALVNTNCYNVNGLTGALFGAGSGGITPIVCVMGRLANSDAWGPEWLSFPVPFLIEIFQVPNPAKVLTIFLSFFIPCIVTMLQLGILMTLTSKVSAVIEKISGAANFGSFGAGGKGAAQDMQAAVKATGKAAKIAAEAAMK